MSLYLVDKATRELVTMAPLSAHDADRMLRKRDADYALWSRSQGRFTTIHGGSIDVAPASLAEFAALQENAT